EVERRRGGRRGILEIVGGIGPAAGDGNELAFARVVYEDGVRAVVDAVGEEWIEAGPLLAQVVEQGVGHGTIDVGADNELGRLGIARDDAVTAGRTQRVEGESGRGRAGAELPCGLDRDRTEGRITC